MVRARSVLKYTGFVFGVFALEASVGLIMLLIGHMAFYRPATPTELAAYASQIQAVKTLQTGDILRTNRITHNWFTVTWNDSGQQRLDIRELGRYSQTRLCGSYRSMFPPSSPRLEIVPFDTPRYRAITDSIRIACAAHK